MTPFWALVITAVVILFVAFVVLVLAIFTEVRANQRRQRIETERMASEARLQMLTSSTLQRMFETARQSQRGERG